MSLLRAAILVAVMIAVPFVVRTREPRSQAAALGFYGLLLALTFAFYEAPDVSLAQLAVGAVALPFMVLLALSRVRRQAELRAEHEKEER